MAQTLLQYWLRGEEPVETLYDNPVKARIGDAFSVDVHPYYDLNFTLREIWVYKQTYRSRTYSFVDYVVSAWKGKEEICLRVRFMPVESPTSAYTHDILVLRPEASMPWDEGVSKGTQDPGGLFAIFSNDGKGGETQVNYERCNFKMVRNEPYTTEVSILSDVDGNGKATKSEVQTRRINYWDYATFKKDVAGQDVQEFLIVEEDVTPGDAETHNLWIGERIDPSRLPTHRVRK